KSSCSEDVAVSGASGAFEALLWHMVYEEEIGSVKGHIGPLNSIAWFRDGAGFVTGGEDGYVRVHHFDKDYFTAKRFE
ncbi:TIF34, partial [Symbiodinium necroappetens]